ncbi:MAG: hypothetical protein Q8P80_04295 [Candidatus Levybacteria bacterium]|nr:hypothetical protein [Candidatus Levybacteria bacterium]
MDNKILKHIQEILKRIQRDMITKEDLRKTLKKALSDYPTKKDFKKALNDLAVEVTLNADKNKAEKAELKNLEKRVDIIEENLQISSN